MTRTFINLSQKEVLTHAFFLTLFVIVPTLAFVRPPGEPFFPMSRVFLQDTLTNCVMLGFFYLNYYILIPRLFFPKKYFYYGLCVVTFLALTLTLSNLVGKNVPHITEYLPEGQKQRLEQLFHWASQHVLPALTHPG